MKSYKKSSIQPDLFAPNDPAEEKIIKMAAYFHYNVAQIGLKLLGKQSLESYTDDVRQSLIDYYNSSDFGSHLFDWETMSMIEKNNIRSIVINLLGNIPSIEPPVFTFNVNDIQGGRAQDLFASEPVTESCINAFLEISEAHYLIDYSVDEDENILHWTKKNNHRIIIFNILFAEEYDKIGILIRKIRQLKQILPSDTNKSINKILLVSPDARYSNVFQSEGISFYHFAQ